MFRRRLVESEPVDADRSTAAMRFYVFRNDRASTDRFSDLSLSLSLSLSLHGDYLFRRGREVAQNADAKTSRGRELTTRDSRRFISARSRNKAKFARHATTNPGRIEDRWLRSLPLPPLSLSLSRSRGLAVRPRSLPPRRRLFYANHSHFDSALTYSR